MINTLGNAPPELAQLGASLAQPPRILTTEQYWEATKKWVTRALAISTSLGVLIVTLYFLKIHYLPIDSFSGIASLGGVVALMTCGALTAFAVLWGAPSAINLLFESGQSWKYIEHRFWSHKEATEPNKDTKRYSKARVFIVPALSIGVLWICLVLMLTKDYVVPKAHQPIAVTLLAVIWLFSLVWFSHERRPPVSDIGPMIEERGYWGYLARTAWFSLFSFSGAYPLAGFISLSSFSTLELNGKIAESIWLVFGMTAIILLNGVNLFIELAKSSGKEVFARGIQLGLAVVCVLLVLIGLSATSTLHDRLMQAASVRIAHTHLALQKSTCDALKLIGVQISNYSAIPGAQTTEYCVLLDVTILSKLGSQWKVACARDSATTNNYRGFTIDSKDVVTIVDIQRNESAYSETKDVCLGTWGP